MDIEKIDQIDRLASAIGRSRAWILNQATDRYLEYEEWFVQQVEKGVADATRGDILSHDQVIIELRSKVEKANSS